MSDEQAIEITVNQLVRSIQSDITNHGWSLEETVHKLRVPRLTEISKLDTFAGQTREQITQHFKDRVMEQMQPAQEPEQKITQGLSTATGKRGFVIPKQVETDSTGMPIPMDTELRQAIYNKTTIQHNQKTGNLPNASRFVQMVFDIEEAFDSSKMDSWTDTEMKRRKVYNAIAQVLDEKYSDLQIEAQAVLEVIIEHETPTPESTPEPTPEETPEPAPETDDPVLAEYAVLKELGEDKLNTNTGLIDDYTFLVDRGYGEEQSGILFRVRKVDSNDTKSDWNVTVLDRSDVNDQKAIVGVIVERKGGIRPNQQVVKTPKDAVLKSDEPTEKPCSNVNNVGYNLLICSSETRHLSQQKNPLKKRLSKGC